MPQSYTPEFKRKFVHLHGEKGHTYKSITAKYGVSKTSISKRCGYLHEECHKSPEIKEEYDSMKDEFFLPVLRQRILIFLTS